MWTSLAFAALLLVISAGMLLRHRSVAGATAENTIDDRERDYLGRQYRRRVQASSMIGIIGLMLIGGLFVRGVAVTAIYWGIVIFLVLWMTLLAVADIVSTRLFYDQLRKDQLAEHADLQSELQRIRDRGANGRPREDLPDE